MTQRPTAVVFDLGNVLVDWDPYPAIAAGVGADSASDFMRATDVDFYAWNHQLDSGMSSAEAEAQIERDFPHWHPHVVAYREHFERTLLGTLDDTVAILEELDAAGVDLFALTNWPAELFPHARNRFGFLSRFAEIVVSGEVGVAKPDLEIFAVLRDRVDRPLEACVFVDDKPENVAAAAEAGMDALLFIDAQRLRADLVDRGLL